MLRTYHTNAIQDALRSIASSAMALVLLMAVAAPVILGGHASAAQVTNRKITISTSKVGATSVTYSVSFNPVTNGGGAGDDIKGIVVDFCQSGAGSGGGPLVGTVCGKTNGISGIQTSGAVAVTHSGATGSPVNFTAQTPAANSGSVLVLTDASGLDVITPANPITFSFTATNPTGSFTTNNVPATFYARIITYNTTAGATTYDSTSTGVANPGTHLDDGGIALSTANQLTVNARVQEELQFCIGTVDSTVNNGATFVTYNGGVGTCAGSAFSSTSPAVDLGVVSSSAVSISPVAASSGGNGLSGTALIQTNAANGASITYFAEQDTSSGRLKVAGAACNSTGAGAFDAGSNNTDKCFGSSATQSDFTVTAAGQQEEFGMTASSIIYPTGSTTTNLSRDAAYDGDGTAAGGAGGGWAWQSNGSSTTLATSSTVLDYEALILQFAARTAATTPTGQYTLTSTYVATPTF